MNRFGNGEEPEIFHGEGAAQEADNEREDSWLEEAIENGFDNNDGAI